MSSVGRLASSAGMDFAAAAGAGSAAAPAPLLRFTEKKIQAVIARIPAPLWGKVGAFLAKREAATLLEVRTLAAKRERQKNQSAAKMAAVALTSPLSSRAAERAAIVEFAADYWSEALVGKEDDFAVRFVHPLIRSGAPFPYTFPVRFGEIERNRVHRLALDGDVTPDILTELRRCFPNLQSLILKSTDGTNSLLRQIVTQWPRLKELALGYCFVVTDVGVQCLQELPYLQSVELVCLRSITNVGFGHLVSLNALQHLLLPHCHNSDDTWFNQLVECPHLLSFAIGDSDALTDAGFAKLSGLTELRSLSFGKLRQVTRRGYASLVTLPKLERLYGSALGGVLQVQPYR